MSKDGEVYMNQVVVLLGLLFVGLVIGLWAIFPREKEGNTKKNA